MLPIAGQTTGPIELKFFFVETQERPGVVIRKTFIILKRKT